MEDYRNREPIRGLWKFDRETRQLVKVDKIETRRPETSAPNIITDEMPPTWHPVADKMYTSKKKFSEETRVRGLEEIGNEKIREIAARNRAAYEREDRKKWRQILSEEYDKLESEMIRQGRR